jgi:excisionase family DNA binding protein
MINPNTPLTLIEAAKLMGVSSQTVRRLIQREVLTAKQSLGPHGLRWEIDRADLLRYLEATRGGQQPLSTAGVDHYQHPHNPNTEPPQNAHTEVNNPYQPVDHGQQEPQQPLSPPQQDQSVPLAAHLAALELARAQLDHLQRQAEEAQRAVIQAERAKISLEAQLGQYQRVLAEQAESLAEERAHRMTLEAAKAQVVEMPPPPPLPEVEPKLATARPGWGGRLRRWLGLSKQDTA